MDVTGSLTKSATVLGSPLQGEQFAIQSDAAMFDVLSNKLYSNPKLAVLRETITNAVDAHLAIGLDEPVEIITDRTQNVFIVKDKGQGIPHDQIHSIYCTYGGSTKRDSNATGGFGLGCKSPFAVTEVFTISNCYGGIRKTYVLNKDAGIPKISSIENEVKDSQSGLTVTIPLLITNQIDNLIKFLVSMGGIKATLNGEELDYIKYPAKRGSIVRVNPETLMKVNACDLFGDRLFFVRYGHNIYKVTRRDIESHHKLDILARDCISHFPNISYLPLHARSKSEFYNTYNNILDMPPNSIDITPSRESLQFTPKTVESLTKMFEEDEKYLTSSIDVKKWEDLYKNKRVNLLLGVDNLEEQFEKNNCALVTDIISRRYTLTSNTRILSYNIFSHFEVIAKNKFKTFSETQVKLAEICLKNCPTLLTLLNRSKIYPPKPGMDKIIESLILAQREFDSELRNVLRKNSVNYYNFCRTKYPVNLKETDEIDLGQVSSILSCKRESFCFPIFKIILIHPKEVAYKTKQDIGAILPQFDTESGKEAIYNSTYNVTVSSYRKAKAIQESLEKQGWVVLNTVKEKIPSTTTTSGSDESFESLSPKKRVLALKDPTKAYYVTREFKELISTTNTKFYTTNLFSNYYPLNHSFLEILPSYTTYEDITLNSIPTKKALEVFQNNNIMSVEEMIEKDVKEICDKSPSLKEAANLLCKLETKYKYYSVYNSVISLLWLVLQIDFFTDRYNLPKVSKDDFKVLCIIRAMRSQYGTPIFVDKFKYLYDDNPKLDMIIKRVDEILDCSINFKSIIDTTCSILTTKLAKEAEGTTLSPIFFGYATNILDLLFLEEETSNE